MSILGNQLVAGSIPATRILSSVFWLASRVRLFVSLQGRVCYCLCKKLCRCRRGHVVLFAISAEGEEELLDHPLIGQPFVHVERLADCPIGCTSLILAARCSVYVTWSSTPRASLLRRESHLGLLRDSHMPTPECFNMGSDTSR